MSNVAGFADIPISAAAVRGIAEALEHARQALQLIPPTTVSDDPLMRNYASALTQSRNNLQNVAGVLEHLLERAAQCH